jgi:hypothetical protein
MGSFPSKLAASVFAMALLVAVPLAAEAQGRGGGGRADGPSVQVEITATMESRVREFYSSRPAVDVESLPPGIRRNLERGKPLPPGIAKKAVPTELRSRVEVSDGFELVEVGLDVFLVEVATSIIHDVLMDVIR